MQSHDTDVITEAHRWRSFLFDTALHERDIVYFGNIMRVLRDAANRAHNEHGSKGWTVIHRGGAAFFFRDGSELQVTEDGIRIPADEPPDDPA